MLLSYNKRIQRIANILSSMITGEGWMAIKELAELNDCTERTIYNDVNYLVKHWGHLIPLDISHTHIVYPKSSVGNIQLVRERILADQKITKLLKLIIENPLHSIEFYASEIEVSVQSVRYLFAELEHALNQYGIELNTKTKKVYIYGDELRVRFFCAIFYFLFQRCYHLEKTEVQHGITVSHYIKDHSILSRFMEQLVQVSVLRFSSGFEMSHESPQWSFDNDISASLLQFIDELRKEDLKIQKFEEPLFEIINDLGYKTTVNERDKIRMILALIIYMQNKIFVINNVRYSTALNFMNNFKKVNSERYSRNEQRLSKIMSHLATNHDMVLATFIFTLDSLIAIEPEAKHMRFVLFSDTGVGHGKSLARYLHSYFPDCSYINYDGKADLQIPSREDMQAFCDKYHCAGVISTIGFSYRLNVPILTVSDYFIGNDIGRIFDFIHSCGQ